MFKKMKLKHYLLIVFSEIIVLTSLITVLGIVGFTDINNNMQDYETNILGTEGAIKSCRIEANVAARNLREMALLSDKSAYPKFTESINEARNNINKQIAIFKTTHGEDDGLAKKYEDAFNGWFGIAERVITQLENGNRAQATKIILNECSPALNNLVSITQEIADAVNIEKQEIEKYNEMTIKFYGFALFALFLVCLIASLYSAAKTTVNIVRTTDEIKHAVTELSKGNLATRVDYDGQNEFGELAKLMNFSFNELSKYITAIDNVMSEFSKGNFAVESPIKFLGDFAHIQQAIEQFQENINHTLIDMDMAATQVSDGSEQVSSGAQALAQGASEQASSVELLSSNISDISLQISEATKFAANANNLGKQAGELVQSSQYEMKNMLEAIKQIAASSQGIQKIIKTIDDIAFQTNILALNAAVEAARAGSAGKGFAVVADEVRNLAQKSATAAKSTTELIDTSLQQVVNGERLAFSTDAAFDEVAANAEKILQMVDKIALSYEEQAESIAQISQGVNKISDVVQMNSATSEESAAASEELSTQANVMKTLIERFELSKKYKKS